MWNLLVVLWLGLLLGGCMNFQTKNLLAEKKLNQRSINELGEEYFEHVLSRDPFYATYIGDHRFDHLLPDITANARKEHLRRLLDFKQGLLAIDPSLLNSQDSLRYDFLAHEITTSINLEECKFYLWVVDQLEGPQIALMEAAKNHNLNEPQSVVQLLERYRRSHDFFMDHISNLREGRREGLVAAKINVSHVIDQLENQLAEDPKHSPFMIDSTRLPSSTTKNSKAELIKNLENTISSVVYPALRAYRDYLKFELLPDARDSVGLNALRLGKQCYQHAIARHTGLKKSPAEIHQEGLEEVHRIQQQMRALIREHSDLEDEKAYMAYLKSHPAQYLTDEKALIAHNQQLVKRAMAALPNAFGKLPKQSIEVVPLEDYRQKHAPAAYYHEAPANGQRPAVYYLNTYQPHKRPLYNMAALAFHEAVPGHHLQIALANENINIPRFQRHLGQTAFVEGWALYAELLARELGLYHSVEEIFGSLNYELWRAVRLVVDTGIHYHGWSREKALVYLANNSALTTEEITNEIDRYIVWPGQALAYKIGQMEFLNLRKECEEQLKERFSLKDFHDQVLKNGAVPMATLRNATMRWLETQQAVSKK